jgi:ketosteroid isomerase-like protein
MHKPCSAVAPALAASLLLSCAPQPAADTRAEEEKAILAMEAEWSKSTASGIDAFVSYYSEDASVFPPNAPVATGHAAIKAGLGPLFSAPGFSLSFQSNKVEVARSGDIAYSSGSYTLTMNDAKGNPMTDKGKFVTAFRKDAEGKWKVTADMFNTDMPLPGAPAK